MRRAAACFAWGLLAVVAARASTAPGTLAELPTTELPQGTFEGSVDVALRTMVVRVVDSWGGPILGLGPADLRVSVRGREIPVTGLDWVAAIGEEVPPPAVGGGAAESMVPLQPEPAAGRLVVVFVQADLTPTRVSGQLRLRPHTRELLDALRPEDRVAVVSFDSHLKVRQDFGADLAATHAAIDEGMRFAPQRAVRPSGHVSLLARFDAAGARTAASPERALELVARALADLPGEKVLIFLGYGLGRFDGGGVRMRPAYAPAVRALRQARAAVFVLDVTSADSHSLEVGLEEVAAATGGAYFSTYRLPALATRTLTRAISGYYVLTLDEAALGGVGGRVRVELRGRAGTVLARPLAL
jgi:VWFA-related protein